MIQRTCGNSKCCYFPSQYYDLLDALEISLSISYHLMTHLLLSTCVYPAVQSSEGRVGVTRNLSHHGSDVTDHPGFCSSGWVATEEYRGQRMYSPCVPQSQVNTAHVHSVWCLCAEYCFSHGWILQYMQHMCVCSSIPCCIGMTVLTTGPRAQTWTVGSRPGVTRLRPLLPSPSHHPHRMVCPLCLCQWVPSADVIHFAFAPPV